MKNIKMISFALFLILFTSNAYATCVQNFNTVGFMGLDSTNGNIYVSVSDHTNKCHCNHVRFLQSKTDTKAVLSILLAAKMSKTKVRIDLEDDAQCNTGFRVYLH